MFCCRCLTTYEVEYNNETSSSSGYVRINAVDTIFNSFVYMPGALLFNCLCVFGGGGGGRDIGLSINRCISLPLLIYGHLRAHLLVIQHCFFQANLTVT